MIRALSIITLWVALAAGVAVTLEGTDAGQRLRDTLARSSAPALPSLEVQHLADQATMTDRARDIFYRARPQIDKDRSIFETHCRKTSAGNGVELGCYTSNNRIYILNIDNDELDGEMVVAAAHEMLHAAFARLSRDDRVGVITHLEEQVPDIQDRGLTAQLRQYRLLEPGQQDNELHSLLGTEYAPLSTTLDAYYSRYFLDRTAVVSHSVAFKQAFSNLETRLHGLESQIRQMRQQMATDLSRHNVSAYNSLVPRLNGLVREYNDAIDHYNLLSRSLLGEESPVTAQ